VNEADWAALYEKYGYLVHRRCLTLLGDPADADDALQEVFLRVKKYAQTKREGPVLAWLYTIAMNCALDARKRRRRETPTEDEELVRNARTCGDAADGDRKAAWQLLLASLDSTTREIGVLHHLGGLTQEEVGARTGYSRRTVGKKLKEFEELVRARLRPLEKPPW
jgi:RNA polymerase sigma-70 factor, ECF subfamily